MNISKNGADFFEIKDGLKFERLRYFPMCGRVNLAMKYDVILGLGANIGRIRFNFVKLLNLLQKDARFSVIATSPILVNKAFGFCEQPDFLNAVIWLKSSKSANEILKIIHNYEKLFKCPAHAGFGYFILRRSSPKLRLFASATLWRR